LFPNCVRTFEEEDFVALLALVRGVDVGGSVGPEVGDEALLWPAALGVATPEETTKQQQQQQQ